jgi:hypothetical protein
MLRCNIASPDCLSLSYVVSMSETEKSPESNESASAEARPVLTPEAKRALAEAEARRKAANTSPKPKEINGPKGPEPTRYGDWEKKGIASDF